MARILSGRRNTIRFGQNTVQKEEILSNLAGILSIGKKYYPTCQEIILTLYTNKQTLVLDIHFLRSLGGFIFLIITFKLRKVLRFWLEEGCFMGEDTGNPFTHFIICSIL